MSFSLTGLAFLSISLAFGFLDYRFWQYYKKERLTISKYFFYAFLILTISFLIPAFVGLFFASNQMMLKSAIILTTLLQNVFCAITFFIFLNYLTVKERDRQFIFWLLVLLGLVITAFTIFAPNHPSFQSGFINWDFNPAIGIVRGIFLFLAMVPLGIIFIKNGFSKEISGKKARIKTIGLGALFLVGVIISPLDFFIEKVYSVDVMSSDISITITSIILFLLTILTQKSPSGEGISKF
jgi:hypothetical protein